MQQTSAPRFVVHCRVRPVFARSKVERAPSHSQGSKRERARTWAWGWGSTVEEGVPNVSTPSKNVSTPSTDEKQPQMRGLYQETQRVNAGFLRVSELHTVYFEEYGNRKGVPALFVHGGPGAGCFPKHARFFDPKVYHIVLMDQRGCGKSTPSANCSQQTTSDIVHDMELLRNHLKLDAWLLLGGSWGVALALAYAAAHPDRVTGLILRGICLMRKQEMDWFFGGCRVLVPQAWDRLMSSLHPSERGNPREAFFARLTHSDMDVQAAAAKSWSTFEFSLALGRSDKLQVWTGETWESHGLETYKPPASPPYAAAQSSTSPAVPPINLSDCARGAFEGGTSYPRLAQAILTCHYACTQGTGVRDSDDERGLELLEQVDNFRQIPCIAMHGRNDLVCPISTAYDLHQAWPEMELQVVPGAGHSQYDPRITHSLVTATSRMAGLAAVST